MAMFTLLLFFTALYTVHVCADLYVIEPPTRRVCHGGQPCTIAWLDDGEAPLLDIIGICYVALYNGARRLVQQIDPVDVSATRSFTFTPSPNAGPNSGGYYVNFTSVKPVDNGPYNEYSSFFTIDNMSGSLGSPVPSLISSIPIPSSLLTPPLSTLTPSATLSPSTSFPNPSSSPTGAPPDQNSALDVLPWRSTLTTTAICMLLLALFELP